MDAATFSRMSGPTAWPDAPDIFSFSALREIEGCPRRWQLQHAQWGEHPGLPRRANERALVGTIVHSVNEALMEQLADRGLPAIGSAAYLEGVKAAAVHESIRTRMREIEDVHRDHPRDPGFRFRASVRDIANEALRLFQAQYVRVVERVGPSRSPAGGVGGSTSLATKLRARGVLTEVWLSPPNLSVRGQVDLLVRDEGGTRIVDLKTGAVRPEYWEQLTLYAVLWWRTTGEVPAALEIAHPAGREQRALSQTDLARAERELQDRLANARAVLGDTPAVARPGAACGHCTGRAFCDPYWSSTAGGSRSGELADRELVVEAQVSGSGLTAKDLQGVPVAVVFEESLGRRHGPWVAGERVRLLGAWTDDEPTTLRVTAGTELFRP
jgi:CRISPR/Cas system-associated exonuclease Cas4 (RecB family)